MNIATVAWLAVCAFGFALSIKSISVLRRPSAYSLAGWAATAAYFALAGWHAARAQPTVLHADYVALAVLTIAFIVAGIRDEPQAEPWWWPVRAGATGSQRRAGRQ